MEWVGGTPNFVPPPPPFPGRISQKGEKEEEDKRKEERGFHDGGSEEGEIEGGKGGTGALEWIQAVLAFPLFLLFLGSIWTKVQVKIEDFQKC